MKWQVKFVLRAALVAQKDQNSVSADYVGSHSGRCLQRCILSVRSVKTRSSMATESEPFVFLAYAFVQYSA